MVRHQSKSKKRGQEVDRS